MLKIQNQEKKFKKLYLRCIKGEYFGANIKLNKKKIKLINKNDIKADYVLDVLNNENLNLNINIENNKVELINQGDVDIHYALKNNFHEIINEKNEFIINDNKLIIEIKNESKNQNINKFIKNLNFEINDEKFKKLKIKNIKEFNNLKLKDIKELVNNSNQNYLELISKLNNSSNFIKISYKGETKEFSLFNEIIEEDYIIKKNEKNLIIQFKNEYFKKKIPLIYVLDRKFCVGIGEYFKISNDLDFVVEKYKIGFYTNLGDKNKNEDRILILNDIICENSFKFSLYAVLDGHNGPLCSEFCMNKLKQFLQKNIENNKNINNLLNEYIKNKNNLFVKEFKKIITESFFQLDFYFYYKYKEYSFNRGSTCNANIILKNNILININLGDSNTIKFNNNFKPIELSKNHNYLNINEINRVNKYGSSFINKRINGILAVSRSFGDFNFKKDLYNNIFLDYVVSSKPDISFFKLEKNDLLLISTDGLFDIYNSLELSVYLKDNLKNKNLSMISKQLFENSLKISKERKEILDNVSIILIKN